MRILLTGVTGQVGTAFAGASSQLGDVILADRSRCDLTNDRQVRSLVTETRPDVIVNAAAYTAVDLAESQRDACFAINATAPRVIAEEAARLGALLIHYSTDYVFDGSKPGAYVEEDATAPLGVYGKSKLAGEQAIVSTGAHALILRTSWVYSLHGKNFLLTILRLAAERPELRIVADQFGSPTSATAIAKATLDLIAQHADKKNLPAGVYHMTSGGSISWCGFAQAIVAAAVVADGESATPKIKPITTAEYPTAARRPLNSVLSNEKFHRTFGFRLPSWQQQLQEVLAERPK